MTLLLQGKYLLASIGLCTKIYPPSPPKMICIFYYQDQNNHPPLNSQFSTLHIPVDLYWDAKTYRVVFGAPRIQLSVHTSRIMNQECAMTKAKEEVSTFNSISSPKEDYLWSIHSTIHNTTTKRAVVFSPSIFTIIYLSLSLQENTIWWLSWLKGKHCK